MKITMSDFAALDEAADVTIHSLTPTLYQVTLTLRGHEQLLAYDDGRPYRAKNLQNVREMLSSMPVDSIKMRHESAYDEMVGQPARQASNAIEIGLAPLDQVDPTVH